MASAAEIIQTLEGRGVNFHALSGHRLEVDGVDKLSEREKAVLRNHKAAILRALPPPEPVTRSRLEKIHPAIVEGIALKDLLDEAHESDYPDLESFETLQAFAEACLWTGTLTVSSASTITSTPPAESGLVLQAPLARGTTR